MNIFLSRSLALATSFMLLLPPCWCCYLGAGECCGSKQKSCCASEKKEAPAKSESRCPFCQEDPDSSKPSPQAPSSKPGKSNEPAKSVCCEQAPIDRPAKENPLPDVSVSILGYALLEIPTTPAMHGDGPVEVLLISSPPVHILHCVWLC
ncbi:MAG TPA: hypothetical protein VKE98_09610 [Gemmataceae bacterium]|nr:hypothetical protein [Gemmataceae bacterium]